MSAPYHEAENHSSTNIRHDVAQQFRMDFLIELIQPIMSNLLFKFMNNLLLMKSEMSTKRRTHANSNLALVNLDPVKTAFPDWCLDPVKTAFPDWCLVMVLMAGELHCMPIIGSVNCSYVNMFLVP